MPATGFARSPPLRYSDGLKLCNRHYKAQIRLNRRLHKVILLNHIKLIILLISQVYKQKQVPLPIFHIIGYMICITCGQEKF